MPEYETRQIDTLLKSGWSGYKMKISSGDDSTHWMNISPSQLKRIRNILK